MVPKSTSSNWLREVGRWTPNLTAFKFHGNQQEREEQKKLLGTHDVTITTYEMVIREKSALRKIKWRYLCTNYHRHTLTATYVALGLHSPSAVLAVHSCSARRHR